MKTPAGLARRLASWSIAAPAPERRDRIIRTFLVGCAALVGMIASFSGFAAMTDGRPTHLLLAAIFTSLIHAMVVFTAHAFARSRGLASRTPWLVGWALTSAVSVALGFGFFFSLFSSSALATKSVGDVLSRLLGPATMVEARYQEMSASARDLANHSRETADDEVSAGGTCSDGNQVADDGPRQRFRLRQAEIYGSGARHFERRAADLRNVINNAGAAIASYDPGQHARTVALVRRAYADAAAISSDPRIAQWRQQLAASQAELAGTIVDPVNGARFVCPDPVLSARLAAAVAVSNVPLISDDAPEISDPSHSAAVRRGAELIMGRAEFDPGKDGTAIVFGAIVDISILLLAMIGARDGGDNTAPATASRRRRRRMGNGIAAIREEMELAADIPASLRVHLKRRLESGDYLTDLLQQFMMFDGKTALLVVPLDGLHVLREAIGRLGMALWSAGLAKPWAVRSAENPPRGWEAQFTALPSLEGASMVRIYRVDADVLPSLLLDSWRSAGAGCGPRSGPTAPNTPRREATPDFYRSGGPDDWDPENVTR